jgi:hypothetical protein
MPRLTVTSVIVVVCYLACGLLGQSKSPALTSQPQSASDRSPSAKSGTRKPPKLKLTAQQAHGLQLLKSAEAEAAGLEPVTRTYILWQLSHGYSKIDPRKRNATLRNAFLASRAIEEQAESADCHMELVCHVQRWMQQQILFEMLGGNDDKTHPERVEALLPQANPKVRKRMMEPLASEYVRKQQFDRVRQLMDQMDEDDYSYSLAGELMSALPHSRVEERQGVLAQAFLNFQNQSLEYLDPASDDFGALVIRFWREMPSLAQDAIDAILARSKDRDESRKAHSVTITLNNGGSLAFGTEYEFRLFQMLPILRELDPSKAEQLLGEYDKARLGLDRYPKGMQSLDPNYYGDQAPDQKVLPVISNVMPAMDDDPVKNYEFASAFQLDAKIDAQMDEIIRKVHSDPDAAYHDAMNLPVQGALGKSQSPRATALRQVAFGLASSKPTLARTAMNEARRLAQDVDPSRQALILANVPAFYLKLGDEDDARGAIKDQMKLAEKLYAIDSDAGDPNLAFKGAWPSTNTWRNCVEQATKISPTFAQEIISEIPDPDIVGIQHVMYANALLNSGKGSIAIVEWHKGGKHGGIFMSR